MVPASSSLGCCVELVCSVPFSLQYHLYLLPVPQCEQAGQGMLPGLIGGSCALAQHVKPKGCCGW